MNVTDSTAVLNATPGRAPKPGDALGKDDFLQLLVAQLRNQDPMNPSNAQEFAAQLAQFSSLEQLTNVNAALETQNQLLSAQIQSQAAGSAVAVIGRTVVAAWDELAAGEATTVDFSSPSAGSGKLRLYDENGEEVAMIALGPVTAGRQQIDISSGLEEVSAGTYRIEIEVTDADDVVNKATPLIRTRVDGVRYTASGPALICGDRTIPLNAVLEVTAN